ncbi:MAG: TIGR01906 family membrane protein [Anaerorhabdus sp.]
MKTLYKTILILATISLFISIFLFTLDIISFNKNFYKKEYQKLNISENMEITDDELYKATWTLLDYIKDDIDTLDLTVSIDGSNVEMFNDKEKLHMIDVKNLYLNAMKINLLLCIFTICTFMLIIKSNYKLIYDICSTILNVFMYLIISLIGLGILLLVDFNQFWLNFHYIFFTNDLFFLDPSTDRLIQMVPLEFFFDLVILISVTYLFVISLIALVSYFIRRKLYD